VEVAHPDRPGSGRQAMDAHLEPDLVDRIAAARVDDADGASQPVGHPQATTEDREADRAARDLRLPVASCRQLAGTNRTMTR